jgi:hypothetical protein
MADAIFSTAPGSLQSWEILTLAMLDVVQAKAALWRNRYHRRISIPAGFSNVEEFLISIRPSHTRAMIHSM